MNIKINKEEFDVLMDVLKDRVEVIFGSHLFNRQTPESDKDVMIIADYPSGFLVEHTPNIHQFQYDGKGIQYLITDGNQFVTNFVSGDSTINTEILLFSEEFGEIKNISPFFTYKIIKAFLGFAKRDLKHPKGKNKLFHAEKGLYIAECLMDKVFPDKQYITDIDITKSNVDFLRTWQEVLRKRLQDMFDQNVIPMYYFPKHKNIYSGLSLEKQKVLTTLAKKMEQSNNTKEFKY